MWTQPKKTEGKYSRRGEVYATVTHRPALQEFGVVAFEMGYPFAPGKELSVSVDGGSAIRIPADEDEDSEDESIIWHPSAEVSRRLVGAMRDGLAMVATGAFEARERRPSIRTRSAGSRPPTRRSRAPAAHPDRTSGSPRRIPPPSCASGREAFARPE